jgi:hypothetical protein
MLIPREHTRDNKPSKEEASVWMKHTLMTKKKQFMRNLCAKAYKRTGTPHTLARHIKFGPGGKKCAASRLGLN